MIDVRPFASLGKFDIDWLSARHHFSFGHYLDHTRMGHGALRVWNDDTIQPGTGFDPHGHRDMEIITYVRRGAITHEDNLGNRGRTEAGDVQVMSAGTGIRHAEYNQEAGPTEIFQIWIQPNRSGIAPRWETKRFPKSSETGALQPLASGRAADAGKDVPVIYQDAAVLGATMTAGQRVEHELEAGRHAYLVSARGALTVNGAPVAARDGVAVTGPLTLAIEAREDAEVVLVDTI